MAKDKKFAALRKALYANDIDQKYLRKLLNREQTYISSRMCGKKPWSLQDMYIIMDAINQPHELLHVFFPPDGETVESDPVSLSI